MTIKNNRNTKTASHTHLRLRKVTGLMLTSALLSAVSLQAGAQALTTNLSGVIDGGMKTGFMITDNASVQIGTADGTQSLVQSFRTVGGAGSGGGAGLGGAFFVNDGASLTVINTDFANNRVQGGNGGSAPPVSYVGQMLNINGRNVDLSQVPAAQANLVLQGSASGFTRSESNGVVTYGFGQVSVATDVASLLVKGAPTIFTDFDRNNTTTISSINSAGLVTLSSPVTTTATKLAAYVAPNIQSAPIKQYVAVKDANNVETGQVIETVTNNYLFTGGTSGYKADGNTLSFGYGFNLKSVDQAVAQPPGGAPVTKPKMVLEAVDIPGAQNISEGDKVFVGLGGDPTKVLANVVDVIRYTQEEDAALNANNTLTGKPKAIVLDQAISAQAVTSIEVIKQPSFNVIPFSVNSNDRTLIQSFKPSATYVPGMSVTWESNGSLVTAKVLEVNGSQVKLDKAVPEGISDLKFVENPLTGDNTVRITNASATFKPGQIVYAPSTSQSTFVGKVLAVSGDLVTVEPETSGQKLADFYDVNLGLGLKISAAEVSADKRTLTVPYNTSSASNSETPAQKQQRISNLLNGRLVKGSAFNDGTKVTGVTVGNGTITITLSAAATTNVIESMSMSSPLVMGGSMNGLTDTNARVGSNNGTNGYSANGASSFFNDAEGVDGTNGRGARDNNGGAGYNGGAGGNGSNGLPVNFWLIYDVTVAGIQLKQASRNLLVAGVEFVDAGTSLVSKLAELAGVAVPDPQGGLGFTAPDPLEIAAAGDQVKDEVKELRLKSKNLVNAKFDLAWAISDMVLTTTNLGKWATELGLGLAGLGGAGGDGGQASGGADFFGGGGGGDGGNGGAGATAISDGGDGGAGGMGGAGGFGAGGGQGGAGGQAGANGNAGGGDPGDGGYAGFGAGQGANGDGMFGGGGSGLGGSIFVRTGGSLLIQGKARFSNNSVAGGSTSSEFGEAGSEAGTDLFMMKGSNVRLQPGQGNTIQFDGTIADDSLATNDGFQNAAGFGADLRIGGSGGNGGGLVILNGENTYSGHTILEGATLSAELGMGINDLSLIRFNGAGSISVADIANNKVSSSLSLDSVGTLLLNADYTRLVGTDPGETAWTGSGGFASGVKGLSVVNLGAINDQGLGQNLVWGSDGFFTMPSDGNGSATNGVLTFGSDYSQGWVEFTNNVNLNGNTARVAVYKNNNNYSASNATLSGNWVNTNGTSGGLIVGDSSGSAYNGTLFMTGQNQLDNLVVAGGTLSTYKDGGAGKLFKPNANLVVLADKASGQQTNLQLFGEETLSNVSVLLGGNLTLNNRLNVSGNFDNRGILRIYGNQFAALSDVEKESLIADAGMSDYLTTSFTNWLGELRVNGDLVNSGRIEQFGQITAANIATTANSQWNAKGNLSTTLDFVNKGALVTEGDISAGRDVLNYSSGILSLTGNLTAGRDFINNGAAEVLGNTTVGRDLVNDSLGLIDVSGLLSVGNNLTNMGSLDAGAVVVSKGSLDNTGDVVVENNLNVNTGSLNNLGTVKVGNAASIATNLTNQFGKLFDVLSGGLTVGGSASNDGTLKVKGNTSVGANLTNSNTGNLRTTAGGLAVGGQFVNAGFASVDGTTTVGGNLSNTNALQVLQGGLGVGGTLNNSGQIAVKGATKVGLDLINNNANSSALATLNIAEGMLNVGGYFDNQGTATVAGGTSVVGNVSNSVLASLTVQKGGMQVGASLSNSGVADVTGGVTVQNNVTNNDLATLTVRSGGLSVEGGFVNKGTSTVMGNSLVRFDLANSGMATFNNDLRVVGSFINNDGISTVNGNTNVQFDLNNNSSAASFLGGLTVGRQLNNLVSDSVMRVNGALNTGSHLTNQGSLIVVGNAAVQGNVNNSGVVSLTGDLTTPTSNTVINNGYWRVGQDSTITTGVLQGSASNAIFCLSNANDTCSNDAATATKLTLDLSSTYSSVFDGVFAGAGSLVKTGDADLLLTNDQTFSGGLTINGGRLVVAGRLNDNLNIEVGTNGTYVVGQDDVVRSVRNNAPHSVVLNANLTTTAGFENNGRLVVNPTLLVDIAGSRLERTLNTGSAGFSGSSAGNVEVAAGTTFRINQNGNSTYAGQFTRMGEDTGLVKEGTGKLTVSNKVDLKYVTVGAGELALAAGNILSSDAVVNIANAATLSLLSGNQSIYQLFGGGNLNLGSNNLSIETGGNFFGKISGTGQVAVRSGSFTISQELSTPDANFTVNAGSITSLKNGAALKTKSLDVRGILNLGESGGSGATIEAKDGLNVYGTLQGGGTVAKGLTTVYSGANLNPGYSPGTLTFTEGLQLNAGSNTTMEIKNPTLAAGVGFDQLIVGESAQFKIINGANLLISNNGMTGTLPLGATVKLFNYSPGKVEGQFGNVTAEIGTGVGALNLSTGNVVGLGSSNMTQIRNAATTANEKAIYSGLLQSSAGNVSQFYGGRFIEKLISNSVNGAAATKAVFNAYNPEAYLSLSDLSQAATQEAFPTWKSMYQNQEKLVAFAGNSIKSTSSNEDFQSFGLGIKSLTVGATRNFGQNTMMFTMGGINSTGSSKSVYSTGSGFTAGVSLIGSVPSLTDATWFTGVSYSALDINGNRQNLNGGARFDSVSSNSSKIEMGVEKRVQLENAYVMMRGALALGETNRGRVNEIGLINSLDTMSIHASRYGFKLVDLGVEFGGQLNSTTQWYGSVNYQAGDLSNNNVKAGYDNDQAQFSVEAKSAMNANGKLLTGIRHKYSSDLTLDASIGLARSWDRLSNFLGRVELTKSF